MHESDSLKAGETTGNGKGWGKLENQAALMAFKLTKCKVQYK